MICNIEFLVNGKMEIQTDTGYYKSNIQDVEKDSIGISIPVNNGKYLTLHNGEKIKCIYFYKSQMYSFDTVVVSRKVDRIFIIMIKKPDEVSLYQRRNFVRVPFTRDILCTIISSEKNLKTSEDDIEFFSGTSLDISGGGIRLSIDIKYGEKLNADSILMLTIPVEDENITVKGKLKRIHKNYQSKKVICGISFLELEKRDREKIIELVFEVMREQIRKGAKEN